LPNSNPATAFISLTLKQISVKLLQIHYAQPVFVTLNARLSLFYDFRDSRTYPNWINAFKRYASYLKKLCNV